MKQKKDNELIKKIIKRAGQCAEESASVFFLYQPKKKTNYNQNNEREKKYVK